jgi:hypothetical protein
LSTPSFGLGLKLDNNSGDKKPIKKVEIENDDERWKNVASEI